MKLYYSIQLTVFLFMVSCGLSQAQASFTFITHEQGVELLENGQAVYFYQKLPKSPNRKQMFNNYLHPLMSLNGDTLSEEFPIDHIHHRGVFWAWHQIYINNQQVADGWEMQNLQTEVVDMETTTSNGLGSLQFVAEWRSSLYKDRKPFIKEHTTITVHPLVDDIRKIDFRITLKALVPNVQIGGSDDEKGYGGLSARLKQPDDLVFTSSNGSVTAQVHQVKAGDWMDFSASFGENNETSGVTILCHPATPNYPAPWILRSKTSMQNIVFPGRYRVKVPTDEAIVLCYRMIIHKGSAASIDIAKLQSDYAKIAIK